MQKRKGNKAEAIKHRVEHTGAHPPVPLPVSEWKFGTTGSYHVSLLKGETPFLSFHLLLPQFCHQLIFLLTSPPAFSSVGVAQLPRSTNHNVHKTVFLFPTAFSRSLLITAHWSFACFDGQVIWLPAIMLYVCRYFSTCTIYYISKSVIFKGI